MRDDIKKKYLQQIKEFLDLGKPMNLDGILHDIDLTNLVAWQEITLLGRIFDGPSTDPHRERVVSDVSYGINYPLALGSPILIEEPRNATPNIYGILHGALNTVSATDKHALVARSINPYFEEDREYALILYTNNPRLPNNIDGLMLDYEVDLDTRDHGVPVFVKTSNPQHIPHILDLEADVVIIDIHGDALTQMQRIIQAKQIFSDYFAGHRINRSLVFNGLPNDASTFIKTTAMGCTTSHGQMYTLPGNLAEILYFNINPESPKYEEPDAASAIANYLEANIMELKQLVAALGHRKVLKVNHADLVTSRSDISLVTGIAIQGLNKNWWDYHTEILRQEASNAGYTLNSEVEFQMVKKLVGE